MERLEQIELKILELKKLDKKYAIFGANTHKYIFNCKKSESELIRYEESNGIKLPIEYRNFLKQIGNGGAGPYYGIEKIENGKFADLDSGANGEKIDLSKPFKFNKKWNFNNNPFKDENGEIRYDLRDIEYFKPDWANGLLRIANFGCGVSINLIVNGDEYGNIWVDDRCNEKGIYPFKSKISKRTQFLAWYEEWLDNSIKPFVRISEKLKNNSVESVIKEEWDSKNFNVRSYIYSILDVNPLQIPHYEPKYNLEMERYRIKWLKQWNTTNINETERSKWWKF